MKPQDIFPTHKNWGKVNIASHAVKNNKNWLQELEGKNNSNIYGGFLGDRSPLFDERHDKEKNIHLGNDFWLPAGTDIFPLMDIFCVILLVKVWVVGAAD